MFTSNNAGSPPSSSGKSNLLAAMYLSQTSQYLHGLKLGMRLEKSLKEGEKSPRHLCSGGEVGIKKVDISNDENGEGYEKKKGP